MRDFVGVGGGGEAEGEGAREPDVADTVARAPERRRGGEEAAGGGSLARQRPRLRQPDSPPRRVASRLGRRRQVPPRVRRRRQRPGSLEEHGMSIALYIYVCVWKWLFIETIDRSPAGICLSDFF